MAFISVMDTAAMASEMVVLSSNDARFTPGQIISAGDGVVLSEGARLSLISMNGDSLVLTCSPEMSSFLS